MMSGQTATPGDEMATEQPVRRPRKPAKDSATAKRILEAAKRILTDHGYSRLTLEAIERESGEFRALVAYYYGNKQGLVQAVVDSLMEDEDAELQAELAAIPDGNDRVAALLEAQRHISADWRGFRAFYELLPNIMHDDAMRARLAEAYRSSRAIDCGTLAAANVALGPSDLEKVAALSVAVVEGLAVQYAADREGFDHDGTFRLWIAMLLASLRGTTSD